MKYVLILHGFTTEYRVPFFKELNRILLSQDIVMKVVIGQPSKYEQFDEIEDCPFFVRIRNKYFYFGEKYLLWEPVFKQLSGQDLIIMRQAKKHLVNPFVFSFCKLKQVKTAFWGNMKNYIYKPPKISKSDLIFKVDHWFAYNNVTKDILAKAGFPNEKITSIQNAIDATRERTLYEAVSSEEVSALRRELGISPENVVGLFCSRLYADKRIDFLLETVTLIKQSFPAFSFLVIGNGPDEDKIREYQKKNADWFFWVGSKYGVEKIKLFKLTHFQLLPGAVGLHIIDSFALGTPIITTQSTTHGVEIDYLENGENGIMTENSQEAYQAAVLELCQKKELRDHLRRGCEEASKIYTIENMAQQFAVGIMKTLNDA